MGCTDTGGSSRRVRWSIRAGARSEFQHELENASMTSTVVFYMCIQDVKTRIQSERIGMWMDLMALRIAADCTQDICWWHSR